MFSLLKLVNILLETSKHSTERIWNNSLLTPPQSSPEATPSREIGKIEMNENSTKLLVQHTPCSSVN